MIPVDLHEKHERTLSYLTQPHRAPVYSDSLIASCWQCLSQAKHHLVSCKVYRNKHWQLVWMAFGKGILMKSIGVIERNTLGLIQRLNHTPPINLILVWIFQTNSLNRFLGFHLTSQSISVQSISGLSWFYRLWGLLRFYLNETDIQIKHTHAGNSPVSWRRGTLMVTEWLALIF